MYCGRRASPDEVSCEGSSIHPRCYLPFPCEVLSGNLMAGLRARAAVLTSDLNISDGKSLKWAGPEDGGEAPMAIPDVDPDPMIELKAALI